MALHLSYATGTYRPPDDVIPGNAAAKDPVEFDLAPAEGADIARIRSILVAVGGTVSSQVQWGPAVQEAVVAAFSHGAPAFIDTVTAVRGLTVPAVMARRAGLIRDLPTRVQAGAGVAMPDPDAPVPIRTGLEFSRVCGFVSGLAMHVANEIVQLTNKSGIDARFFARPSGSGGPEISAATSGSATPAPNPPDAPATADAATTPAS